MDKRTNAITLLLAVYLLVAVFMPVSAQVGTPGVPGRIVSEMDAFTYRTSFQTSDGTEIFLIRSAYTLRHLYQHHHPTINHHYMRISVGFYYGKTLLGRPIIDSIEFDNLAFYAKWIDSAGYSFDLKGEEDMFSLSGSVEDGKLVAVTRLLDNDARSRYMPLFGGTYVLTDFKITLIDEAVIDYGNVEIEVVKSANEFTARDAQLVSEKNLTYESDEKYLQISSSIQTPLVVLVDAFVAVTLFGGVSVTAILVLLHVRGRIELPIDRLKGIIGGQNNGNEERPSRIEPKHRA